MGSFCAAVLFVPSDSPSICHNLCGRSDQSHQLNELPTKFLDAGFVYPEGKEGFDLFRNTGRMEEAV